MAGALLVLFMLPSCCQLVVSRVRGRAELRSSRVVQNQGGDDALMSLVMVFKEALACPW